MSRVVPFFGNGRTLISARIASTGAGMLKVRKYLTDAEGCLSSEDLARLQCEQRGHDLKNHFEIFALHKTDRLKHYGLHFAKYVGRLARGKAEPKPVENTLVDAFLVSLSSANALNLDLSKASYAGPNVDLDSLTTFADASGRFADGCEKIDHLEEFLPLVLRANVDIVNYLIHAAAMRRFDLKSAVEKRRQELALRNRTAR